VEVNSGGYYLITVLVYTKAVESQHQIVPIFLKNEEKLARKSRTMPGGQ